MSDISNVDAGTTNPVASTPAATPTGADTQGSAPAPVDTTESATADAAGKEPDKQSRREARAFASQRRQINELQRMVGNLQGQLQARAPAQDDGQASRSEPNEVERLRAEMTQRETERVSRRFWADAAKDAKEKGLTDFADAQDAIRSGEVPTTPAMSHYITEEAENPAAMIVWLADNPDEAERIAGLDPVRAGAALAKQDARLGAKPAKKTTQAPPPVPTVGGRSTAEFDPADPKGSMEEYAAYWKARQAKKRG